jgi:hypothetical protein
MFKKKKVPNPQAPRSLDDINQEYRELLVKVATAQYLVYIKNAEIEQLNRRLLEINQEGAARQELDKASEPKKEVKNENA